MCQNYCNWPLLPAFEYQVPQTVGFDLKFEGSFQNSLQYAFVLFPFVPPGLEASIPQSLFSINPSWWEGDTSMCTSSLSLPFSSLLCLHCTRITNRASIKSYILWVFILLPMSHSLHLPVKACICILHLPLPSFHYLGK